MTLTCLDMATILDPLEIYDRGLQDLSVLQGPDRLVFMLQDFDNLMEMEGWDHFFRYEHHFAWYGEMKEWLHLIAERESLAVLESFETYLDGRGVPLLPDSMESPTSTNDPDYESKCVQWCSLYSEGRGRRWARAAAYLRSQGVELLGVP